MVSFQETNSGLVNTDWSSTPPPSAFPVLCEPRSCGNALPSTFYNVIWGARRRCSRSRCCRHDGRAGGAGNDVSSLDATSAASRSPSGVPQPVLAAKVRSQITQAGALGDPYGSGTRTIWWVYGVGPVKIVFQHAGGSGAP